MITSQQSTNRGVIIGCVVVRPHLGGFGDKIRGSGNKVTQTVTAHNPIKRSISKVEPFYCIFGQLSGF